MDTLSSKPTIKFKFFFNLNISIDLHSFAKPSALYTETKRVVQIYIKSLYHALRHFIY